MPYTTTYTINMEREFVPAVTINTDASFNHHHKIGGFAFYIRFGNTRLTKAAPFKGRVKSAHEAEIMAIGNALYCLLHKVELPKAHWLIINCDCTRAMDEIKAGKTELSKNVRQLWLQLRDRLGVKKAKFRHVKAHNGTPDARSWVNDWCDKQAKAHMREKAKQLVSLTLQG